MSQHFDDELAVAHSRSFKNRSEVLASEICGCFYCKTNFPPERISEWMTERDGEQTALCPNCGIDSVIGSASGFDLTGELLDGLHVRYFSL